MMWLIVLVGVIAIAPSRARVALSWSSEHVLDHVAVDGGSGRLYVGATDRVYALDADLRLLVAVRTGPELDDPRCSKSVCPYAKTLTHNINKVLAVDAAHDQLVTCGSLFQGVCELRALSNISAAVAFDANVGVYIATNDDRLNSTVAFVAPGPAPGGDSVLYVGVTYSGVGYRQNIPAVSTRALAGGRRLQVAFSGVLGTAPSSLRFTAPDSFPVSYMAGFSEAGYSYLLTVQPVQSRPSELESRLVQICQDDKIYTSYVEIPIKCGNLSLVRTARVFKAGRDLKLPGYGQLAEGASVLIASFASSGQSSAVCLYPIAAVRRKFTDNIKHCNDGNGFRGKHLAGPEVRCRYTEYTVRDDYCGETSWPGNTPLAGALALQTQPVLTFSELVTAVAGVAVMDRHTVIFLGTSSGYLKRIHLDVSSGVAGHGFSENIAVAVGEPVSADLVFSPNKSHIYVMTTKQLAKIAVQDCVSHASCVDCRKDPYCGWCSLQNECTTYGECAAVSSELRWLTYHSQRCLSVTYSPHNASIWQQQSITLSIRQLPPLSAGQTYLCQFGDGVRTKAISLLTNLLLCYAPERTDLPALQQSQDRVVDYVHVTLRVYSSETGVAFLQTDLQFFDCSRHHNCTSCTGAVWDCRWCVHDNKCIAQTTTCSNEDSTTVDVKNRCPHIEMPDSEILLPVGVATEITLSAAYLPQPQARQTGYECLVYLREGVLRVPAERLSSSELRCQQYKYDYTATTKYIEVRIEVVWNDVYHIDNSYLLEVTIYKCAVMGLDCSMCLSVSDSDTMAKYRCVWCGERCAYDTSCSSQTRECGRPIITNVVPSTGPIEGGTLVTIRGSNLGREHNQIRQAVTIVGRSCISSPELYKVSRQIVCRTGDVTSVMEGQVVITIGDLTDSWSGIFKYQNPVVERLEPSLGPISGGTRLTLHGRQLDTGKKIEVHLGEQARCIVVTVSSTRLLCQTAAVSAPVNTSAVYVSFEGVQKMVNGKRFQFTPDPNITKIWPLQSFMSGGRMLTVTGEYFHAIQQPEMFFSSGLSIMTNSTSCTVLTSLTMRCWCPVLARGRRKRATAAGPITVDIGFVMDGVKTVQNVSENFPHVGTMTIQPDPVYDRFEDSKRIYRGDNLQLTGSNLDLAATKSEVFVSIGVESCTVNSLDRNNLYCTPPDNQPAANHTGALPLVTVRVGNLRYELGELEYRQPLSTPPPSNKTWMIAVGVIGGVLVLIIIFILIAYNRNSSAAIRRFKKMQGQLDTLESSVRIECKQAFAELQTEVCDFTSDLNVKGIPYWDYKTYTFKVLFPSLPDHPVMHKEKSDSTFGSYDQGLQQFNQLLNSKQFLLIFIRTLEQQKNFSIRDKSIVASLLMIVLQDKMEYATEILKALLNELIDRSVEKKHPKLMLRRTESVVEKFLANWMSLCMYDHIKRHTGSALFMLYKAIKHQTEKGPVDVITAEARYSLSEDRLLRQKIEFNVINLTVTTELMPEPVTCKVLDCDTVTQVKEKVLDAIYMNTPFSQRPSIYDIDLEWRSGKSGHLPLQDEDVITEVIRKQKRVNTLQHYSVPAHAEIVLVLKANGNDMIRKVHGMLEITSGTANSAINPIVTLEEGTKVWHLVKVDDHNAQRGPKVISEIFLTRLLATKGTLQQYIDDLLLSILRVDYTLAPAVKHLFDFFDSAARRHNIVDQDVVHTWKSNSLPLRFWVNIIKNPEFVFDIHKSNIVDSCLSVIAQTFMDSCSTVEHRLGKDSPSNKLLFAKDVSRYRHWVGAFYRNIREMPPVSDQEINTTMMELSMNNRVDFNVSVALKELFKYAVQYHFELLEALDDNPSAKKLRLSVKFEQIVANIDGPPPC